MAHRGVACALISELKSCYARDTAISMEAGTETPVKPSSDSGILQYRETALMVDTGARGDKALPADVVD